MTHRSSIYTGTTCNQYISLTVVQSTQCPSGYHHAAHIHLSNLYLAITYDEQYFAHPVNKGIMKCLVSKKITTTYHEAYIPLKKVML